MNDDGSHRVPVKSIGSAYHPRCFRDSRFAYLKGQNNRLGNAWMDSEKFNIWVQWWYNELRKLNQDNILLIMDNCGGHECNIELPELRVELLAPKTTHKYQTLDLGLIAQSKVRYKSMLLRKIVENTIAWNSNEYNFPQTSHFGDAMELFNQAKGKTKSSTILKCWIKSNCLSEDQVELPRSYCTN